MSFWRSYTEPGQGWGKEGEPSAEHTFSKGTQRGREGVTAEVRWGWERESSPEGGSSQPAVTECGRGGQASDASSDEEGDWRRTPPGQERGAGGWGGQEARSKTGALAGDCGELEGPLSQNTAGSSQWSLPRERPQQRRGRAGEASGRDGQEHLVSSQGRVSFRAKPLFPEGPSSGCSAVAVLLHGEQGWRLGE